MSEIDITDLRIRDTDEIASWVEINGVREWVRRGDWGSWYLSSVDPKTMLWGLELTHSG